MNILCRSRLDCQFSQKWERKELRAAVERFLCGHGRFYGKDIDSKYRRMYRVRATSTGMMEGLTLDGKAWIRLFGYKFVRRTEGLCKSK